MGIKEQFPERSVPVGSQFSMYDLQRKPLYGAHLNLQNEHELATSAIAYQAITELEVSIPTVEHAAEIECFCVEVFPARYDNCWYAAMLASESIYKLCFRWKGRIIALIVGQAAVKEFSDSIALASSSDACDSSKEPQVAAYIMLLGVLEPYRKFGLASRLLLSFQRTVNLSYPSLSRTFYLHVATDNSAAMRMYSRQGFLRISILPQYYNYAKDNAPPDLRDAYLYAKEVLPASECLEHARDCADTLYRNLMPVFSYVISVLIFPVKKVFRLLASCVTSRLQKVTLRTEAAKVV
ncbi:N-alpha-acetyltransferase 60-like isoform X2 [Paramacrobiotus metropolitanus]|uniref:N-alpha-acetyltransferase 60-like isoform X2 n=1 Tax=Paramacrobiotus metropolitanus TaxID=2943436 RepID=UPI0024464FED|nr:N-alpha-acetyltransferase 60-like isoform X2 [Paramacrobiotus metropolitanus]